MDECDYDIGSFNKDGSISFKCKECGSNIRLPNGTKMLEQCFGKMKFFCPICDEEITLEVEYD